MVPALRRQKQEDICEFQASQNYRVRPCLINQAGTQEGSYTLFIDFFLETLRHTEIGHKGPRQ